MKKTLFALATTVAALAMVIAGCAKKPGGDALARIKARGEIVVATEGTWSPWTFHDEADKLVGFDVEVARAIAEKLGVAATFAETEWDGIFAGLDSGRYDITCNGVEITDERAEKYDFSDPYGYIHTALIVRTDTTDIADFADLNGKTTANSLGSTYAMQAERYGANVQTIDTLEETLQLVEHDRVDATLNADVSFFDYMRVHPQKPFKIVAISDEAAQVAIPLRKGEDTATLREAINAALAELAADGTLSAISQRYFKADITK